MVALLVVAFVLAFAFAIAPLTFGTQTEGTAYANETIEIDTNQSKFSYSSGCVTITVTDKGDSDGATIMSGKPWVISVTGNVIIANVVVRIGFYAQYVENIRSDVCDSISIDGEQNEDGYIDKETFVTFSNINAKKVTLMMTESLVQIDHVSVEVAPAYGVTYNLDGGSFDGEYVDYYLDNKGLTLPTNVKKTGFAFGGWYTSADFTGDAVTAIGTSETGDKEFFAKWLTVSNITYNLDGGAFDGEYPNTYVETIGVELPTNVTKEHSYFIGWFDSADFAGAQIASIGEGVTGDQEYFAMWELIPHSITYNTNGGTINDASYATSYNETEGAILPTNVTKEHFTFAGWYDNSGLTGEAVTEIGADATTDKVFYAKWNYITHNITYNLNGGEFDGEYATTYQETVGLTLPTNVTKDGYGFVGWYDNEELQGTPVTAISDSDTGNKEYFAKWGAIRTITYNENGGTINGTYKQEYVEAIGYTLPTNVTRTHYSFGGWYEDSEFTSNAVTAIGTDATGDKEFFAKWVELQKFQLDLHLNGGVLVGELPEYIYEDDAMPSATRAGYTFAGWYDNEELQGTPVTAIGAVGTDVVELYAKWIAGETIEIDTINKTSFSKGCVTITVYDVGDKDGVKVRVTSLDNRPMIISVTGDAVITGVKLTIGYYFRNAGGLTSDVCPTITMEGNDDHDTYVSFSDFYTKKMTISSPNVVQIEHVSVELIPVNGVTYELNGGSFDGEYIDYYFDNSGLILPTNVTRKQYNFVGWYESEELTGEAVTEIASTDTGNKVFYAKWKPVISNVTFNANGGEWEVEPAATYTETIGLTLPTNITKAHYTFAGWYDNSEFTGEPVTAIDTDASGNKEFWAKWERITHNITYNLNGGEWKDGISAPTLFNEGERFELVGPDCIMPVKTGYMFYGWFTSDTLDEESEIQIIQDNETNDVELWAAWGLVPVAPTIEDVFPTAGQTEYIGEAVTVEATANENGFVLDKTHSIKITFEEGLFPDDGIYLIVADGYEHNPQPEYIELDNQYNEVFITSSWGEIYHGGYSYDGINIFSGPTIGAPWPFDFEAFDGSITVTLSEEYSEKSLVFKQIHVIAHHVRTVTYNENDGTMPEGYANKYLESRGLELPIPTRNAYAFIGWYDNEELEGEAVTKITVADTGDKVFYAKWEFIEVVDLSKVTGDVVIYDGQTITGTLGGNYKITIEDGATVTLKDVTINGVHSNEYAWAGLNLAGSATLILSGDNTVVGFYEEYPGIFVPQVGTLTISGEGTLIARSNGYGAGIGGGAHSDLAGGNIVIENGTVTAYGGSHGGAGIGSGYCGTCGDITITGGIITAEGGSGAAGIGGGAQEGSSCGTITIASTVAALSATLGGNSPTSIGQGIGGTCGTVTIRGEEGAITDRTYVFVTATAEDVIALINEIGEVEYTEESKEKIVKARRYYDLLSTEEQAKVGDSLATLEAAENTYIELHDTATATETTETITNLPSIENITLDDKDAVVAARAAYDALSDEAKAKVPAETLAKLVAAEKEIDDIEKANEATGTIDALPAVDTITTSDKETIEQARAKYNALTDDQKAKVSEETLAKLVAAESALQVATVSEEINALPSVDAITLDSKETIENARAAYNALTDDQKAKVSAETLAKLVEAEEKYAELKDADDTAKATPVIEAINALPEAENVTRNDEQAINDARTAYNALTDAQKAKVSNIAKLEAAEAAFANTLAGSETFETNQDKTQYDGKYIVITCDDDGDESGFSIRSDDFATIASKNGAIITKVELTVGAYESYMSSFRTSAGTFTYSGNVITINDPNAISIRINTSQTLRIKGVKVYFLDINALPASGSVTVENRDLIHQANDAYNALSDNDKANYPSAVARKLNDAKNAFLNALLGSERLDTNKQQKTYEGETFTLTNGDAGDKDGFSLYGNFATITATNGEIILKVEFVKGFYNITALTSEVGKVTFSGDVGTVSGVFASSLTVHASSHVQIKAVKVYFLKPEYVQELISFLPALDELTFGNKEAIEWARATYDALTEEQKASVSNLATLEAVEAKFVEVADAYYTAQAASVTETINALPTSDITLTNKAEIKAARAAYEALADEAKAKVSNETLAKLVNAETALASTIVGTETFDTNKDQGTYDGEYFTINCDNSGGDDDGFLLSNKYFATITAKNGAIITKVEFTRGWYNINNFRSPIGTVTISGDVATVSDLYVTSLRVNAADYVLIKKVKVYFVDINSLPASAEVTLANRDIIHFARETFRELSDADKANYPAATLAKLTAAEEAIQNALLGSEDFETNKGTEFGKARTYDGEHFTIDCENEGFDDCGFLLYDSTYATITAKNGEIIVKVEFIKGRYEIDRLVPEVGSVSFKGDVATVSGVLSSSLRVHSSGMPSTLQIKAVKVYYLTPEYVEEMITILPASGKVVDSDLDAVEWARTLYNALTDAQKESVSNLEKLVGAEQEIADIKTARDTGAQIDSLLDLEEVTLDNKDAVVAARAAYNALTDGQKEKFAPETLEKLVAAEKEINDIETANAADAEINELLDIEVISIADKEDIQEARAKYNALTADQKKKVPQTTLDKLVAAEKEIVDIETANAADTEINNLLNIETISLDDKATIAQARAKYNALTEYQKKKIPQATLDKLVAAEKEINDIETSDAASDVITNLPSVDDITLDNKDAIEQAKKTYDDLSPEAKEKVDPETVKKLEAAVKEINDIETSNAATDDIVALSELADITLDDKTDVESARAAYEALSPEAKKKVTPETLEKLVAAEAEIEDCEVANDTDETINALPELANITLNDKTDVEAARAAYEALTPNQKSKLPSDTLAALEAAEAEIADCEEADKVDKEITDWIDLTDITLEDKTDVQAAREAYEALTDNQKTKFPQETLAKIEAAEAEIVDCEIADEADKDILALIDVKEITVENKADVQAAREAYEALTDNQKTKFPQETIAKIEAAEKEIVDIETSTAVDTKISNLPAVEEMTILNRTSVRAAKAAYDALSPEAKAKVPAETVAKLEAAIQEIADLETVNAAVKSIDVVSDTDELTLADESAVQAARAAYEALTDAQKAKVDAETLARLEEAEAVIAEIKTIEVKDGDVKTYSKDVETGATEGTDVTVLFDQAAKDNSESKAVEIKSGDTTVVFDANAVNQIGGNDVTFSATIIDNPDVEGAVFGIDLTLKGSTFQFGKATVSTAFDQKVPFGKKAVVYYVAYNGELVKMNTWMENGRLFFETNHFSPYVVKYELTGGSIAGIVIGCVIGLALIILLIILIVKLLKKRNKKDEEPKKDEPKKDDNVEAGEDAKDYVCIAGEDEATDEEPAGEKAEQAEEPVEEPAEEPKDEVPAEEEAQAEEPVEEIAEESAEEPVEESEEEQEDEVPAEEPVAVEEPVEEEPKEEPVTLKQSMAVAKTTTHNTTWGKAAIAKYLADKHGEEVEINERENFTSTGLPLADTHYAKDEDTRKCFVYVYETEGAPMLLINSDEALGKELAKRHSNVHRSAFPKSKDNWYSLPLDDSYSDEDVQYILDRCHANALGRDWDEQELSLKESLALAKSAKAEKTTHTTSKNSICEYLAGKYGDEVELNTRDNYTRTGLPLADTHYVHGEDGKDRCFVYVYETQGSMMLLVRANYDFAKALKKNHPNVHKSAFPKSKEPWNSIILDDSFSDEEVHKLLDDVIALNK